MKHDLVCPDCKKRGFLSSAVIWNVPGNKIKCAECGAWSEPQRWKLPNVWIPVVERLPMAGLPVLGYVTHCFDTKDATRVLRVQHAPPLTLEQHKNCDGGVYDEVTDTYYCEEGWYETNEFEDVHWNVDGTVTHWMALPLPPVE